MTIAIARLEWAGSTYSTDANRYCMTTALLAPSSAAPAQKPMKWPPTMAAPATMQPMAATSALPANTTRRPKRRIRAPAGRTLAATPTISTDTGRVASVGVGARPEPMIPPSRKKRKLPDMQSDWVAASIQTGCMGRHGTT